MSSKENKDQVEKTDVIEEDVEKNDQESEEQKEIQKLKEELSKEKEKFLRVVAEYDNYRKRTEKDRASIYHDAISKAVTEILPVADSLTMAAQYKDVTDKEDQKGLELVSNQLAKSLEKLSVESFGKPGDVFDPEIHNAIAHVDDDQLEENVIVEVFQLGYKIGDKIIRHAMVKVAN